MIDSNLSEYHEIKREERSKSNQIDNEERKVLIAKKNELIKKLHDRFEPNFDKNHNLIFIGHL